MNIFSPKRVALNLTTDVMSHFHSQNRVVEGSMDYGSGGGRSSPLIAMASSIECHNGSVSSNDTPKRPTVLGVNTKSSFAAKNSLGEDSDAELDEGSMPCTPELQLDDLENVTRQLITRFLKDYTGLSKPRWNESKALSTMKRVVEGVLEKHRYAYNGMVNKLSLDDRGDNASFVTSVAKSLFADNTTNWGRIASLVAFGAVVSQSLKEKGRGNCVELVGQEISTYLLSDQREWLVKNNSWDGFVEFFRVADPESTVRNTLMACVGFAGIGATLALLIR